MFDSITQAVRDEAEHRTSLPHGPWLNVSRFLAALFAGLTVARLGAMDEFTPAGSFVIVLTFVGANTAADRLARIVYRIRRSTVS